MVPSRNFREDSSRAVFVTGEIDEAQVHRLTPDICRLRGLGCDPITVYINSRGGQTFHAEHIRALLKAPTQDGAVCRLITVATNRADSAAADLLALGDYAIAYPRATIHCHGTRMSADQITKERAEFLAVSLKETNEDFALRLARRTFARMALHFANLRGEFPTFRRASAKENPPRSNITDLECFAAAIFSRLSRRLRDLPKEAYRHHEILTEMRRFVFNRVKFEDGQDMGAMEAEVLKQLLEFELSTQDLKKWRLSSGGIEELAADFASLVDFISGPHRQGLEHQITPLGPLFLNPGAIAEYEKRRSADRTKAEKWLRKRVTPIVEPLWYFVVSLCRLLQRGEYSLAAVDAYWLGIVDEVVGERLPTLRLIAENPEL